MSKRGQYYTWSETSMKLALQALRNKEVGLNEASRIYGVPKATLKRRLDGSNQTAKEEKQTPGSAGDLTPELEEKLYQHILEMEACLYGLTPKDVRSLAFKIAEKNNIKHRFNKTKKMAGKKWYYAFLKRHRSLSLRQPRATSINRATAFNKPTIKDFFEKLEKVMDEHGIHDPRYIYNVDETGLSTVQRKPRKILAKKGKHQVGALTSGERGFTTTAVCCASAAGHFVPPLVIFKRKNAKDELRDGAPPGSIFAFNPDSGYINSEIFFVWLQHFVECVKPTTEQKVLLLLDGHTSHTKNLDAIKYAKENNVVLLSLPAHTSNKLQPLDTSFFRPLSCYYIDETEKWLRTNPGRRVTVYQISMLFGKAYARAASIATAESGFRSTGIYPFNKDIFQDYEFVTLPEDNDNLPAIENENMIVDPLFSELNDVDDNGIPKDVTSDDPPFSCTSVQSTDVNTMQTIPSASKTPVIPSPDLSDNCNNINIQPETPIIATKEVKQWQPLPSTSSEFQICSVTPTAKKVMQELRKGSRKPQSAIELTASPYKTQLEESKAKASKTKSDAEKRKKVAALNLEKTVKSNRRPEKQIKKDAKRKKVPAAELEKWFCKICLHCAIEDMIQCLSCKCWVHEECACVKKGIKKYICPSCTD
ncbi:unnamed protein product [Parnassius mnemosyne]|uniref:HTH CENPB-type domain-containing protein n=1 Tax=Parnassius mnemosyne TaxID=213953 RepID=A0AAV1K6C9_9NEOP